MSTPPAENESTATPAGGEAPVDAATTSTGNGLDHPAADAPLASTTGDAGTVNGEVSPTLAPTTADVAVPAADPSPAPPVYDAGSPPAPPVAPTATDGAAPSPEDEEEEGMTMLEHLEELRNRIVISCVALALGLVISALPVPGYASLTQMVISVIGRLAAGHLQFIKPGEGFITYFQVALTVGFALAMPVLIYQMMKFVLPALHPHEKKYLYMAIPGVTISFAIGLIFGYVLVLPVAIEFLLNFGTGNVEDGIEAKWSFGEYISTVTSLLFWMGMAFETPLIMFFLTKLRVLTVERMTRFRRYALVSAFIIGAIITPTPDPLNQVLVSLPIYLLYELGLLLARLA